MVVMVKVPFQEINQPKLLAPVGSELHPVSFHGCPCNQDGEEPGTGRTSHLKPPVLQTIFTQLPGCTWVLFKTQMNIHTEGKTPCKAKFASKPIYWYSRSP